MGNGNASGNSSGNADGDKKDWKGLGGRRLNGRLFSLNEALNSNGWWNTPVFKKEIRDVKPLHEIRMEQPPGIADELVAEGDKKRRRESMVDNDVRLREMNVPMKKRRSWRKSGDAGMIGGDNEKQVAGKRMHISAAGRNGDNDYEQGVVTKVAKGVTITASKNVAMMPFHEALGSNGEVAKSRVTPYRTNSLSRQANGHISRTQVEPFMVPEAQGQAELKSFQADRLSGKPKSYKRVHNDGHDQEDAHVIEPPGQDSLTCHLRAPVLTDDEDEVVEVPVQETPVEARPKTIEQPALEKGPIRTFKDLPLAIPAVTDYERKVDYVSAAVDPISTKVSGPSETENTADETQEDNFGAEPRAAMSTIDITTNREREKEIPIYCKKIFASDGSVQAQISSEPLPAIGVTGKYIVKGLMAANSIGLVWTKLKGHPYWPSQMVSECIAYSKEERFSFARNKKKMGDDTCVMYFGSLEVAWVNRIKCCVSYTEGIAQNFHHALDGRPLFEAAVEQARALLARLKARIYPAGWWCEPSSLHGSEQFMSDITDMGTGALKPHVWSNAIKRNVFWVKIKGFPYWPIVPVPDVIRKAKFPQFVMPSAKFVEGNKPVLCYFFGARDLTWVRPMRLIDFQAGACYRPILYDSANPERLRGVGQAVEFIKAKSKCYPWDFDYQDDLIVRLDDEYYNNLARLEREARNPVIPAFPKYEHVNRSVFKDGEKQRSLSPSMIQTCSCSPTGACCPESRCINRMSHVICDPRQCHPNCQNKPFHKRPIPKVSVFWSPDGRGWGLRAEEVIPGGTFIVEYVGEIIHQEESDRRLEETKQIRKTSNAKPGVEGFYMMHVSKDYIIDAMYKGNLSRFINSSCNANCATQKWRDASSSETRVGIFALRDIKKGEELLYDYCFEDYGFTSKAGKRSFICLCGEDKCRMWMDGEREEKMKRYGERVSVKWDDGWYEGTIVQYFPAKAVYKVDYDDGDSEVLALDGGVVRYRTLRNQKRKRKT